MALTTNKITFDGILLIDKPRGCTSHDIVDHIRRKLKMKRIGHAGTLDPLATGLLIILVGKATKASQYLMSLGKEYTATMLLGSTSDSQDADGKIIEVKEVPFFSQEQIETVMKTFEGDQYQIPPMFSAKKVQGIPLYKFARKGQEIEREHRFIHISEIKLTGLRLPEVDFQLKCTKGTYVRTIAHDIGQKLGCGAHLIGLRRTATDKFNVSDAIKLADFEQMSLEGIKECLIPIYEAVPKLVL